LFALGLSASCSDGDPTDCICNVTVGENATVVLACGETRCLGGRTRTCDLDVGDIVDGDPCNLADLAVPTGTCPALQMSCDPSGTACCAVDGDGGVSSVTCDPSTRTCCVPSGATCRSSTDCCGGHTCVADVSGGAPHCGL
jgi:hypothetical protein